MHATTSVRQTLVMRKYVYIWSYVNPSISTSDFYSSLCMSVSLSLYNLLMSVFVFIASLWQSFYKSRLCVNLSLRYEAFMSICCYISLSIPQSLYTSLFLDISLSVFQFFCTCVCLYVNLAVSQSFLLSVWLYISFLYACRFIRH